MAIRVRKILQKNVSTTAAIRNLFLTTIMKFKSKISLADIIVLYYCKCIIVHGCPYSTDPCSIFHRFRQHFGRNGGYFFTNVVLELFYGPWLVNVNLWLQISPQEEVRRRQIGRTRWPVQITTFRHQTARKQFLQEIDCYATFVRWSAILLKPELSHTLSTNNWHHKIGHHGRKTAQWPFSH